MKKNIIRAIIETSFIIFLFYSNLLMGEFTHSSLGYTKGLAWAVCDVFTVNNFIIGLLQHLLVITFSNILGRKFRKICRANHIELNYYRLKAIGLKVK